MARDLRALLAEIEAHPPGIFWGCARNVRSVGASGPGLDDLQSRLETSNIVRTFRGCAGAIGAAGSSLNGGGGGRSQASQSAALGRSTRLAHSSFRRYVYGVTDEPDLTAGHSARREYERRLAIRERQKAAKKRSILAALKGPSADEKRQAERDRQWAVGARGEEMLARSLARHCPDIPVLADRRLPGTRTNLDFLAIAASGVYVIDAKRYHGKIEIRKPLFGKQSLWIAGRNRTKLVEGLTRQVDAVKAAMASIAAPVPVRGCFCFVVPEGLLADTDLPLLRTLRINGYPLLYPRKLGKHLRKSGPLSAEETALILAELGAKFPPA